jgi:hypothetical protein
MNLSTFSFSNGNSNNIHSIYGRIQYIHFVAWWNATWLPGADSRIGCSHFLSRGDPGINCMLLWTERAMAHFWTSSLFWVSDQQSQISVRPYNGKWGTLLFSLVPRHFMFLWSMITRTSLQNTISYLDFYRLVFLLEFYFLEWKCQSEQQKQQ